MIEATGSPRYVDVEHIEAGVTRPENSDRWARRSAEYFGGDPRLRHPAPPPGGWTGKGEVGLRRSWPLRESEHPLRRDILKINAPDGGYLVDCLNSTGRPLSVLRVVVTNPPLHPPCNKI